MQPIFMRWFTRRWLAAPVAAITLVLMSPTAFADSVGLFEDARSVRAQIDLADVDGTFTSSESFAPASGVAFDQSVSTDAEDPPDVVALNVSASQDSTIDFFSADTFSFNSTLSAMASEERLGDTFRIDDATATATGASVFNVTINTDEPLDVSVEASAEIDNNAEVHLTGFNNEDLDIDLGNNLGFEDTATVDEFFTVPAGVYNVTGRVDVSLIADGRDNTKQGELDLDITGRTASAPTPSTAAAGVLLLGLLMCRRGRRWRA